MEVHEVMGKHNRRSSNPDPNYPKHEHKYISKGYDPSMGKVAWECSCKDLKWCEVGENPNA